MLGYIIGVYFQPRRAEKVKSELIKIVRRMKASNSRVQIVVSGDLNLSPKTVSVVSSELDLVVSKENMRTVTRSQLRSGSKVDSTLDYFMSTNEI